MAFQDNQAGVAQQRLQQTSKSAGLNINYLASVEPSPRRLRYQYNNIQYSRVIMHATNLCKIHKKGNSSPRMETETELHAMYDHVSFLAAPLARHLSLSSSPGTLVRSQVLYRADMPW